MLLQHWCLIDIEHIRRPAEPRLLLIVDFRYTPLGAMVLLDAFGQGGQDDDFVDE